MKTLRAVLGGFMAFFCVVSASLLFREISDAARSTNDPAVEWPPIVRALVVRALVCAFFAWLAVALWRKNRRPAKTS